MAQVVANGPVELRLEEVRRLLLDPNVMEELRRYYESPARGQQTEAVARVHRLFGNYLKLFTSVEAEELLIRMTDMDRADLTIGMALVRMTPWNDIHLQADSVRGLLTEGALGKGLIESRASN